MGSCQAKSQPLPASKARDSITTPVSTTIDGSDTLDNHNGTNPSMTFESPINISPPILPTVVEVNDPPLVENKYILKMSSSRDKNYTVALPQERPNKLLNHHSLSFPNYISMSSGSNISNITNINNNGSSISLLSYGDNLSYLSPKVIIALKVFNPNIMHPMHHAAIRGLYTSYSELLERTTIVNVKIIMKFMDLRIKAACDDNDAPPNYLPDVKEEESEDTNIEEMELTESKFFFYLCLFLCLCLFDVLM